MVSSIPEMQSGLFCYVLTRNWPLRATDYLYKESCNPGDYVDAPDNQAPNCSEESDANAAFSMKV